MTDELMTDELITYNESIVYAAEAFARVSKEAVKIIYKKYNIPISHNEYLLLEEILLNPGIAQGNLARKTLIQRSYVSKLLATLENNKYITREQENKSKQIIAVKNYITELGEETYKNIQSILVSEMSQLISSYERDELDKIKEILFKHINTIKKAYNIKF